MENGKTSGMPAGVGRWRWASAAFLFVATVLAFLRCWDYGIVNLDDYSYLGSHAAIMGWHGWDTLRFAFGDVGEGIWMPLTWLSYALDYSLHGFWYGGFHLTSVFVHAVNAVLVLLFLRELFADGKNAGSVRAEALCLLGAVLWAVHPLRCESVVFLASRKDVLSFFWEALALLFWVRGSRNPSRSNVLTALACACFVVGSLCKPSVMTFPVLCFVVDACVFREVRVARYVLPVAYMLFLGPFAAWQQRVGGATDSIDDTLLYRIANACAAIGVYLRNFVWPLELAPQCIKTWPRPPRFLLPGLVVCAALGWRLCRHVWTQYVRRKDLLRVSRRGVCALALRFDAPPDVVFAGVLWFLAAMFPMLGIARFGYHAFADRFTYIPAVGLSIAVVACAGRYVKGAWAAAALPLALAAALGAATWRQTGFWHDDHALFSRTVEVDGEHNAIANVGVALWYFEFPHDLEKCVERFERAIKSDILYTLHYYDVYIMALAELGRTDEIPDAVRKYEGGILARYGEERAAKIWRRETEGLTRDEYNIMTQYARAKVAWWLCDKSGIPAAEEEFDQVVGEAQDDPIWVYLMRQTAILKGDAQRADELLERLSRDKVKGTYVRFRYLHRR